MVLKQAGDAWLTYERPKSLDWVTEQYGAFAHSKTVTGTSHQGAINSAASGWSATTSTSTGYDVAEAVRQYLKSTGNSARSICEVLQQENSPHVGTATVFISHTQALHIACLMGTLKAARGLFPSCGGGKTLYWIDFFTLQQCQRSAFVPEQIMSVMETMEACIIEIDRDAAYIGRAFCVFEAFAAVKAGVLLQCLPKSVTDEVRDQQRWDEVLLLARKVKKMDCAKAESRYRHNTDAIKRYVSRTIGFADLNAAVSAAILLGMDRTRPGKPGSTLVCTCTCCGCLPPDVSCAGRVLTVCRPCADCVPTVCWPYVDRVLSVC